MMACAESDLTQCTGAAAAAAVRSSFREHGDTLRLDRLDASHESDSSARR
jgi:hypothetical protein